MGQKRRLTYISQELKLIHEAAKREQRALFEALQKKQQPLPPSTRGRSSSVSKTGKIQRPTLSGALLTATVDGLMSLPSAFTLGLTWTKRWCLLEKEEFLIYEESVATRSDREGVQPLEKIALTKLKNKELLTEVIY